MTLQTPFFRDSGHEHDFRTRGYVIQPLLNKDEIKALFDFQQGLISDISNDYYITLFHPDIKIKRQIHQKIRTLLQTRLEAIFFEFELITSSFVYKPAFAQHGITLHQDPSFVDHARYAGVNFWCPLISVDEQNGCMELAPGSQMFDLVCSIPPRTEKYETVQARLEKDYLKSLPMEAGSVLLFDTRILHKTTGNTTAHRRPAAIGSIIPAQATPCIYFNEDATSDNFQVYRIDDEFLIHFNPAQKLLSPESHGAVFLYGQKDKTAPLTEKDITRIDRFK